MDEAPRADEAKERDDWFALSPSLAEAIGWVVLRSAMLDDLIREIIDDLVQSDVASRLLSGQSSDWLCQAALRALEDADYYKRTLRRGEPCDVPQAGRCGRPSTREAQRRCPRNLARLGSGR